MDRENQPRSLQSPWWLGKAKRHRVLLKFIIICVVIALLFLGIIIFALKTRESRGCGASVGVLDESRAAALAVCNASWAPSAVTIQM